MSYLFENKKKKVTDFVSEERALEVCTICDKSARITK